MVTLLPQETFLYLEVRDSSSESEAAISVLTENFFSVARKLLNEGRSVTVGEKVAYAIVKGPGALFQKAKTPDKVKLGEIDTEYYVENQIKPAALSILERLGVDLSVNEPTAKKRRVIAR